MKKYYITPKEKIKLDDFSYYDLEVTGGIEDIKLLEDFIEDEIVEKLCNKRIKINKNQYRMDANYHCSIALNKLICLKFSREEFDYVMNYLNSLGIIVSGYDTDLIGLFENYECLKKDFLIGMNEVKDRLISKSDTSFLFSIYNCLDDKTSHRAIKIRNQIIEGNLGLVSVALKYVPKLLPMSELESHGYMGLILCIEKFNPDLGCDFDTYAVECIKKYVVKMIGKDTGISSYDLYRMFLSAKNTMDRKYYAVDYDDIEFIEELFVELGLDDNTLDNYSPKNKKTMLKFKYNINRLFNNYIDDLDYLASISLPVDEEVDIRLLQAQINEILNNLSPEEKEIIFLRYGFYGKELSYSAIGKILGVMRETVRKRCIKIEQKLKQSKKMQMLRKTYL